MPVVSVGRPAVVHSNKYQFLSFMQQFLGEAIKIQIGDVLMCKRESFVCVIILLKNQFP